MEINWFTVIAQIVNFLILVWLLKRFLYKPVLKAIDEREEKIASRRDVAEAIKVEAKREHELFQQKNEVFDKERTANMAKVHEEANLEKQRLMEEVRNKSTALRIKYESALMELKQEMTDTLKRKTKDTVFAIAGKTLSDLADTNLEEQAVTVFKRKIRELDEDSLTKLKHAFSSNKVVTIKSAFELSSDSKSALEKAIREISERQNDFQYRSEPKLVSGIEIYTGSYQLSWNIEAYLDDLKNNGITKQKENATV